MYREAIAEAQKYPSLSGDEEAAEELGRDFASYGQHQAMEALRRKTLAFLEEAAKYAYVSSIHFAFIHAKLGENDQAFAWLEKALQERQPWLGQLQVDPHSGDSGPIVGSRTSFDGSKNSGGGPAKPDSKVAVTCGVLIRASRQIHEAPA